MRHPVTLLVALNLVLACTESGSTPGAAATAKSAAAAPPEESEQAPAAVAQAPSASRWVRLYSDEARASSFLKNNWNKFSENYHPNYILDDNPQTAWVEGANGQGTGEWIEWDLTPLHQVDAVRLNIKSGYQKSKSLHAANSTPTKVRITAYHQGIQVAQEDKVLSPRWGRQTVSFTLPPERGLDRIRLTVLAVKAGRKYQDTCISDVQTEVKTAAKYEEKMEKGKQKRVLHWIKGRRDEALAFKKLPKTYPYAGTHFKTEREKLTQKEWAGPCKSRNKTCKINPAEFVQALSADSRALFEGPWMADLGVASTPSFAAAPPATPDGLYILQSDWATIAEWLRYAKDYDGEEEKLTTSGNAKAAGRMSPAAMVQLADVTFFEAKAKTLGKARLEDPVGYSDFQVMAPQVVREKGKVVRVNVMVKAADSGRESANQTQERMMLVYDDQGRLQHVVRERTGIEEVAPDVPRHLLGEGYADRARLLLQVMSIGYNQKGQVAHVDEETVIATQGFGISVRTARYTSVG